MKTQSNLYRLRPLIIVAVIAVLLFGGIGATNAAAQSAIPGDALYSVKTYIEQTQLNLSQNAGNRAQLKIAFAQKRLDEISTLIREGRYREIKPTVLSFEAAINGALLELETVAKTDPARVTLLTTEITSALTQYAQILTTLATTVPETIQPEINRALDSALLAGSLEMPAGNSNDNDNGNDDNGNDDNGNDDNGNDDNGNDDNGNDDNGNDDNGNDDNGNDDNGNDDGNENDDDDDNGNDSNDNG